MIYYTECITLLCVIVFALYIRQEVGLKKIVRELQIKRKNNSSVVLTTKTYSRSLDQVIQEINDLFAELQVLQITTQQEKSTLDLAIHNITHDIRTPLTIANGYLYQLRHTELMEDTKQIIEKIECNLKKVANRLEILLEYQDLLESNVKPKLTVFNFSRFFTNQLMAYYDSLTQKQFKVSLEIQEDLRIENDEELLSRILQNLFSNILKHGQDELDIRLQKEGKFVQLILLNKTRQPIVNLSNLTARFYSENLSESENSSGLGLYIVQELVTLSHGYLELSAGEDDFQVIVSWQLIQGKHTKIK
ncbi:MAG: sensor histidine kinase [Enterococcus sp.]